MELEDVRILAHHLVLQERQLGHTTITVYCLPANSSNAAQSACRYNSTAASAAGALADARAKQVQGSKAASASVSSRRGAEDLTGSVGLEVQSIDQQESDDSSSQSTYEEAKVEEAPQIDLSDPEQLMDALPLVESSTGSSIGDVHRQAGTWVVIRGRAGSTPEGQDGNLHVSDPAIAVEEQQRMQKQQGHPQSKQRWGKQQQQQGGKQLRLQQSQQQGRQQLSDEGKNSKKAADKIGAAVTRMPSPNIKSMSASRFPSQSSAKAAAVKLPKLANVSSNSSSSSNPSTRQPPKLTPENSWQVAFEEDAYSVGILDAGHWSHPMLRLSYTSFTTPQSIIDIDMFTQRRVVRSVAEVGGGFRSEAYRRWVGATDSSADAFVMLLISSLPG